MQKEAISEKLIALFTTVPTSSFAVCAWPTPVSGNSLLLKVAHPPFDTSDGISSNKSWILFVCFGLRDLGPHCVACGILVPQPGFEPISPAVEALSPNHWTAREFPRAVLYLMPDFPSLYLSLGGARSSWAAVLYEWLSKVMVRSISIKGRYTWIYTWMAPPLLEKEQGTHSGMLGLP